MIDTSKDKITPAQRAYATDLLRKLGYDRDNYELDTMTKSEASKLIRELKNELWDLR